MAVDVKYRTEDASNNNTVTAKKGDLIPKKPEVDLTFKNLTYTVNKFNEFKIGKCRQGRIKNLMGSMSYSLMCGPF